MTRPKKDKLGVAFQNASSAEIDRLSKLSQKELGRELAGDMPDEWDYNNIELAIKIYDKAHPGVIQKMMNDVRLEVAASGISKTGEVLGGFRKGFWLPSKTGTSDFGLQEWMERAYPSFWQEKKHAEWFIEKFPQFGFANVAERMGKK